MVAALQSELVGVKTTVASLQETIANPAQENLLLKRRLFGNKAERSHERDAAGARLKGRRNLGATVAGSLDGRTLLGEANDQGLERDTTVTDGIAGAVGKAVQARPLPPPSERGWRSAAVARVQIPYT